MSHKICISCKNHKNLRIWSIWSFGLWKSYSHETVTFLVEKCLNLCICRCTQVITRNMQFEMFSKVGYTINNRFMIVVVTFVCKFLNLMMTLVDKALLVKMFHFRNDSPSEDLKSSSHNNVFQQTKVSVTDENEEGFGPVTDAGLFSLVRRSMKWEVCIFALWKYVPHLSVVHTSAADTQIDTLSKQSTRVISSVRELAHKVLYRRHLHSAPLMAY